MTLRCQKFEEPNTAKKIDANVFYAAERFAYEYVNMRTGDIVIIEVFHATVTLVFKVTCIFPGCYMSMKISRHDALLFLNENRVH